MSWDPLAALTRRTDQTLGMCVVAIVILLLVALVIGSSIPLYVAAVPLALLGFTLLADRSDREQ
ncbi:hypothetical protein [Gordonia sihwensis]|uniref:hypothetical protein n=1 Tax=Gordonia sihwensis TaxID=173559 RepID=UPI000A5A8AAE|nr:hypothetical protein [Gordonia sihwensis]